MTASSLRRQWDRDGFVIVRGLFDPTEVAAAGADVDRVRDEHRRLIDVKNIRCRWQDNVFTGECQFDAFDPVIDLSALPRAGLRPPPVRRVARPVRRTGLAVQG